MKILVFGTGEYYERFKKWIAKEEIIALIDNSPIKQNTIIDGIIVLSPKEGIQRSYDVILIMSFYIKTMKKQLLELGVPDEKIFHFYDLRKLIGIEENKQAIQYYGITEQELEREAGKKIGLLSTDLVLGGTAIALFHMAEVLQKAGYPIVFASMMDGPLREQVLGRGIPVVVDPNLQLATMREIEWMAGFRLIVCNAINYYVFLSDRNLQIPMIWWLHDSEFFYDGVDKDVLRRIPQENLTVLSVGAVPEKAIHSAIPELKVEELLYGVEDVQMKRDEKIHFVTIGCIEERKGQDILLQAICLLSKEMREKVVFYLIGNDTSLLAEQIRERVKDMPEIVMTGVVGRREIHKILEDADVMICPSREDPMPTVAAEAMSHNVPCIVSNVTGTAAYIQEKQNGFIFKSENASELAEKIKWCIENRRYLVEIGKRARDIYETVFSMNRFEEEVNAAIGRCLGISGK